MNHWRWRSITTLLAIVHISFFSVDVPRAAEPQITRLTHDGLFKHRPAWSPDGSYLAFTRHQGNSISIFLRPADASQENTIQEKRLTTRIDPESDASWSPDGKRLAFCFDKTVPNQGDMDIYTIGIDGNDLRPALVTEGKLSHEEWPAWSPDGQWLALTSTRDGNQELYIVRPDGKDLRRLTSDPAIDAHPAWSPDSQRIVFATNRWGDLELAIINADGTNLTRLTKSPGLDDYPAWSRDGLHIAFTTNRDRNFEIYTSRPDGTELQNQTNHPALDNFPAWTPAGHLSFVSNRDGGFDLYLGPIITGAAAK